MADYKTPGRQPSGAAAALGTSGSVGRRVVRSALELLVDTASPDLVNQQASLPNTQTPARFTVTHAAAPAPAPPPGTVGQKKLLSPCAAAALPLQLHQQQQQQQRRRPTWASSGSGGDAAEEPSTLLFLSPTPAAGVGGGDSAVKKRLFKRKKKTVKLSDSAKKVTTAKEIWAMAAAAAAASASASAEAATPPSQPGGEEYLGGGIEKEERGESRRDTVSSRPASSPHGHDVVLIRDEPLFTEKEVQQRILEALKAYEAQRDAEEESVLQEVGREIKSQNERYDRLLQEKQTTAEECDSLQGKVEQLALQCEALQSTIAELHQDLQEEREKARRVEVELCHAQDEKRLASSGIQQELNFEKAQWKLAQEEMRQQIAEFEAQLKTRTFEWHELQASVNAKESERVKLSEQLEACQVELQRLRQQQGELQAENTELQELTRAKEALIRQLQHKAQEAEKAAKRATTSTQEEQAQLESRLRSVEDALRQQTDEVRRKMHRVHVLEAEQGKAERATKTLRRAVRETASHLEAMRGTLETIIETCRTSNGGGGGGDAATGASRHTRLPQRGLPGPMFPLQRCDAEECMGTNDNEDDDDEEEDSLLGLVTRRELRDELRRDGLLSGNVRPAQQERRPREAMGKGTAKKIPDEDGNDTDECGRLQRCQQHCERLFVTLQKLLLQRQREMRRHVERLGTKQAEWSNAEIARCREALAASEASLAQGKQQQQQLEEKCHQRSGELQKLQAKFSELRVAEEEARAERRRLTEVVEELRRERGILRLQLEASQQDCVELRERYGSIQAEAAEVQERLRVLEEDQQCQKQIIDAKAKALAKLARCTEKLKKTEDECQTLRDENGALSTKVKSMLLQLQTSRMQQRSKSVALPTRQQQQQQHHEELSALTKELGVLRGMQESAAALRAKECAEAESSLKKLHTQNDGLRNELAQQQRMLADARNEVELQRRAEAATLHTLLSVHQSGSEPPADSHNPGGDAVSQKLFDGSPKPHTTDGADPGQAEVTIGDMRGRVVSLAQRAVLEIARLKEALAQAPRSEKGGRLEAFRAAERLAWEAAQRSAVRRQTCGDEWDTGAPPPLPVPITTPESRGATLQEHQRRFSLGTPRRSSSVRGSPSPMWVERESTRASLPHRRSASPVAVAAADSWKGDVNGGRSLARHGPSSSLTSAGGVSRSYSGQGVLDGSDSPPRPPMLRAPSVR
ncbi:hypothetical protein DQ04_00531040 [Trypanosoma grayi]|uniref:hypothetical protein n=1 Tax=Trypanosoma grayi TaxID=71804 RepID=UPI0004F45DA3|nr:hypothetical protein DQ04_00531040 [Trypanosoma grayi]KEG14299.1 hypothetical protein DQ04_00531040 [Trypanosoma grayi]